MQNKAQLQVWLTSAGWGAHSSCSVERKASGSGLNSTTYTATSSGQGLEEFGNNSGELEPQEDEVAHASTEGVEDLAGQVIDWYVGTDEPPTAGELSEAQAAAGSRAAAEITIPVAQAPVAVLLSLPAGCVIPSGSKVDIDNRTLSQLWEGTNPPSGPDPGGIQAQGGYEIDTWGALLTQLEYTQTATNPPTAAKTFHDDGTTTGCKQLITPQISSHEDGGSYVLKNYFAQSDSTEWSEYADDAMNWPSKDVVYEDPISKGGGSQWNETDSKLAGNTAANPGSVGYAFVGDSTFYGFTNAATNSTFGTGTGGSSPSHQVLWAEVQDNGNTRSEGGKSAEYADPALTGKEVANCDTTTLIPSDKGFPSSYTDSWYGIVATDPKIAKDAKPGDYSICALTYDLVWHHYSSLSLYGKTETAHEVANTVKDLFEYITGPGQEAIESHYYTRFPTPFQSHVELAVNPGIGY